jgi:hypothetical protein
LVRARAETTTSDMDRVYEAPGSAGVGTPELSSL